ncbi:hypothetical protein L2E82_14779 [Cichorium intybus]|uniref:Uncharacterized protein n=1 Tax=Cichorium intybus TaxID=13427 RepID=A0ACB9F1U7_CICIN|nr:hypothetical protein L2E82_14779 [Cichorium intybus]
MEVNFSKKIKNSSNGVGDESQEREEHNSSGGEEHSSRGGGQVGIRVVGKRRTQRFLLCTEILNGNNGDGILVQNEMPIWDNDDVETRVINQLSHKHFQKTWLSIQYGLFHGGCVISVNTPLITLHCLWALHWYSSTGVSLPCPPGV